MSGDLFGVCGKLPTRQLVCGKPAFHSGPCGAWREPSEIDADSVDANTKGKARRNHPETSHNAAYAVEPNTGTLRRLVLEAIARQPRTDEELQHDLTMNPNTERPRRVELVDGGWIEPSGEVRRTEGGAEAIVWQLARPIPPAKNGLF
jgi:hypothetical protein